MQSLPWIYNIIVIAPCQQKFDITLQFLYNIFEVIILVMKAGTRTLSLRIDEATKLRLEMIALQQGRSVNNLLNFIIKDFIEKSERAKK